MARNQSIGLTEAELRVMEVIWRKGKATVTDVVDALSGKAYNTVLTTMAILERKGYLRHAVPKTGRAFLYYPKVSRRQASKTDVRHLLSRFFSDSPEALILNLIEEEELSEAELRRVRELLKEKPE
jgi:predicted transcriptional regulator